MGSKKKPKTKFKKLRVTKKPASPEAKGGNKATVSWSFTAFDPHKWFESGHKHESFCQVAHKFLRGYELFNVGDFGNEWEQMLSHKRLSAK